MTFNTVLPFLQNYNFVAISVALGTANNADQQRRRYVRELIQEGYILYVNVDPEHKEFPDFLNQVPAIEIYRNKDIVVHADDNDIYVTLYESWNLWHQDPEYQEYLDVLKQFIDYCKAGDKLFLFTTFTGMTGYHLEEHFQALYNDPPFAKQNYALNYDFDGNSCVSDLKSSVPFIVTGQIYKFDKKTPMELYVLTKNYIEAVITSFHGHYDKSYEAEAETYECVLNFKAQLKKWFLMDITSVCHYDIPVVRNWINGTSYDRTRAFLLKEDNVNDPRAELCEKLQTYTVLIADEEKKEQYEKIINDLLILNKTNMYNWYPVIMKWKNSY